MSIAQSLLPEFDQEMATTRRLLERVPEDRADWKPHPKSTALGTLAAHIANLAGFGRQIVDQSEVDMQSPGSRPASVFEGREALLTRFDANVRATREALARLDDAALQQRWTLRRGDQVIFALPRTAVLRTMMFSHIVHHRGQLSVYLRLNDVPVPPVYGPTADENPFG